MRAVCFSVSRRCPYERSDIAKKQSRHTRLDSPSDGMLWVVSKMVFFTFTAYAYETYRSASNHSRVWLDENVAKNVANRRIALVLSMATNKSESEMSLSLRHQVRLEYPWTSRLTTAAHALYSAHLRSIFNSRLLLFHFGAKHEHVRACVK